jgi:hypothetical protein
MPRDITEHGESGIGNFIAVVWRTSSLAIVNELSFIIAAASIARCWLGDYANRPVYIPLIHTIKAYNVD